MTTALQFNRRNIIWATTVLAASALGFAAATWVQPPQVSAQKPTGPTTAIAQQGKVGKQVRITSVPFSESVAAQPLQLSGLVTDLGKTDEVKPIQVLFALDGRPVFGIRSPRPFFRDFTIGMHGADVRAFHEALKELKYFDGDVAQPISAASLQGWRNYLTSIVGDFPDAKDLGTGNRLVALPLDTTRVAFTDEVRLGARINEGSVAVEAARGEQQLAITLQDEEARTLTKGLRGRAELSPGNLVDVEIRAIKPSEEPASRQGSKGAGQPPSMRAILSGIDGKPLCERDACKTMNQNGTVPIQLNVVPVVEGVTVPVAAVRQRGSQERFVVDGNGNEITVTVKGSDQGIAVIDGIPTGTTVRLNA